jgi:PKD repeat protein
MKKLLLFITFLYSSQIVTAQLLCNSGWLSMPQTSTINDFVTIGDVDLSGSNSLTVEASFFCKANFAQGGANSVNLVSKHQYNTDNNCNYLLRTVTAEIQTSKGFFATPINCDFIPNRINHVAMVYDGAKLSFYRNGFLVSSIPAIGKIQNNSYLLTKIGNKSENNLSYNSVSWEPFRGFINEVRIWKVARTQEEINQFMNSSLPSPKNQNGLVAYYQFNSLKNLQGNSLYNGKIGGEATINSATPNCDFIADSCVEKPKPVESKSPSADLEYSISKCNEVTFSLANAKNIQNLKWIVENKTVSTANKFTHVYTTDGDYEVTLSIIGTNGETKEINKLILVQKPKALFNLSTTSSPNKIQFKNNPKENINYTWDFGDGEKLNSNSSKAISHKYAKDGTYTVALTATDNAMGCSSTYTEKLVIGKPTATEITNIKIAPEPKTVTANNLPLLDIAPEKRIEVLVQQIEVTHDSIQVSFYDNGVIDGDSITVKYNNKILVEHLLLTANGKRFFIKVEPAPYQNELIMIAENLGSIPPNTSLMIIYDGTKRHEVNISSSSSSNGKVSFVLKR